MALIHEHQRPDRDDYIKVYIDRIKVGYWHDYKKKSVSSVEVIGGYDYESRMHYSATTFAKPFQYNWLSGWSSVVYSKFIRIKNDTISLDPDVEQGEQPAAVKIKVGGRVFEEREITYFAMENLTPVKKTKIN